MYNPINNVINDSNKLPSLRITNNTHKRVMRDYKEWV